MVVTFVDKYPTLPEKRTLPPASSTRRQADLSNGSRDQLCHNSRTTKFSVTLPIPFLASRQVRYSAHLLPASLPACSSSKALFARFQNPNVQVHVPPVPFPCGLADNDVHGLLEDCLNET